MQILLVEVNVKPERLEEIDPEEEIVLQCRSGSRSAQVLEFLHQRGYPRLWNLKGGLLAWADDVDPSMRKY